MSKIITVFGSAGAGKSTVSGMIARHFANARQRVIVCSFDADCPMNPIWLPQDNITQEMSLGAILEDVDMATDTIAKRLQIYQSQSNIGFLAYCAGDTCIDYNITYERTIQAIKLMREICDVLILDCTTSLSDITVPAAIEMADIKVCVLSPDLRGISYYKSTAILLKADKFEFNNTVKVFNGVRKYHAIGEAVEAIGGIDYCFPYHPDIHNAELGGDTANTLAYVPNIPFNAFFEAMSAPTAKRRRDDDKTATDADENVDDGGVTTADDDETTPT